MSEAVQQTTDTLPHNDAAGEPGGGLESKGDSLRGTGNGWKEAETANEQTEELSDDTENSQPSDLPVVDAALIEQLSQGFLAKVMPDLQISKGMLDELMRNQRVLIDTVQQENSKFDECQSFHELEETMKQAKLYHAKLISVKKEMNSLHEKSARLKKRAVKLQQQKQKDELHRAHQRDKEVEREKMLVAKPASASRKPATPPGTTEKPNTPDPSYAKR